MDYTSSKAAGVVALALGFFLCFSVRAARADGDLSKVQHVIIAVQENHSFDNYFGVLALDLNSPYHAATPGLPCDSTDHQCVDGLDCSRDSSGTYTCNDTADSNLEPDGTVVFPFHDANYCPKFLKNSWWAAHREGNFDNPNNMLADSPNDGFVRVNDNPRHESGWGPIDDDTMGFYDGSDLPFYYALAQTFAISDQYFSPVVGQTLPNRLYVMAATSFGHLSDLEIFPPPGGYKPITGTILDLLNKNGVSWVDYYSDLPSAAEFRSPRGRHFKKVGAFFKAAANGNLPAVSFVDPQLYPPLDNKPANLLTDEHPPHDIRSGEKFISRVVGAVRNGPDWQSSIIFITYDENGGFYDHVAPPAAQQNGQRNPDGIAPGQCADLSNRPTSETTGRGANCAASKANAKKLCATFKGHQPYPTDCAAFDQYGFRVPFIAISPFSKPGYVSHVVADHTSMLALIEKRFLGGSFLTARDQNAYDLEGMFDFTNSPSADAVVPEAPKPHLSIDGDGSCVNSVRHAKVSPRKLKFGKIKYGKIRTEVVKVTNPHYGILHGSANQPDASSPFSIVTTDLTFTLKHGQSKSYKVEFAPQCPGTCTLTKFKSSMKIDSDDPRRPTVTVNLVGVAK